MAQKARVRRENDSYKKKIEENFELEAEILDYVKNEVSTMKLPPFHPAGFELARSEKEIKRCGEIQEQKKQREEKKLLKEPEEKVTRKVSKQSYLAPKRVPKNRNRKRR